MARREASMSSVRKLPLTGSAASAGSAMMMRRFD
jgi:hypothetical protein